MFISERELKDKFWQYYNNKGRAVLHQFECSIREGNADLLTIEKYQGNYQLNSFEFKLTNIKQVFLQAEANLTYVHKSWVVIPTEKTDLILDKYSDYLKQQRFIGVIVVETEGRWKVIHQPKLNDDVKYSQAIINLMMTGY